MILARVEGRVVSNHKHPSMNGQKLLICQPIDEHDQPYGVPWLALDPFGASLHQRVIISTDGASTRDYVEDQRSPLRNMIVAVVDNNGLQIREGRKSA